MRWPFAVSILAVIAAYLAGLGHNPPGFNFDESSVAYNAYAIATDGRDEHGVRFPLFFEAFGEFKNPVHIYLLAGAFTVAAPSSEAARALSALLGIATALALARLAWTISRSRNAALAVLLGAAATPTLFEISRLVFEAASFPLAVALFLLAARAAHDRDTWSPALALALAAALALVTYTYTAGRLLGPLFALLLALFLTRRRVRGYVFALGLYGVALMPAVLFNATHDGALLKHPRDVALQGSAVDVVRNYALNLDPVNLAFIGDPNARHHVPGSGGSVLLMTFLLAVLAVRRTWRDRWTAFLLAGFLLSMLPGALAQGVANTLRLSAAAVFLIALGIPALAHARRLVAAILILGVLQAAWFFAVFHREGAHRPDMFDVGAAEVVEAAIAAGRRPIYVEGRQYSHAYWFGALNGVDRAAFRLLAEGERAPAGALVWSDTFAPRDATVLARRGRYAAFFAPGHTLSSAP